MGDNKYIGCMTVGVQAMGQEVIEQIRMRFNAEARKTDDWFYAVEVDGQKYFICDNGEIGYTVMLPSEY